MSEKTQRLPPWLRARSAIRPLGSLRAAPGWLALAYEFLERIHLAHFVAETLGWRMDPVAFLKDWGWLVGLFWLAGVVIWTAMRPDAAKRARSLGRLKETIVDSVRQFESLCKAYEVGQVGSLEAIKTRKLEFALAMERVIKAALHLVPESQQHEYKATLFLAMMDYQESSDDKTAIYKGDDSPTAAIWRALDMHKLPPMQANVATIPPPEAGPQSPTASE